MRKRIIICITNDIAYDRRILRITKAFEEFYDIDIISRRIHRDSYHHKSARISRLTCYFKRGFLFYAEFNIRLLLTLFRREYDILVAVDYDTIIPCAFVNRLRGKKLVLDAHEYFEESMEIAGRKRVQGFWKWIGRKFVPMVDKGYTVSTAIAQEYSSMHGVKFSTIRNVPDKIESAIASEIINEKAIVLYQGVLNQGRRLEMLVDCAQYLGDGIEVWIVGEGDLSKELKKRFSKNVVFHSWVAPERLSHYTKQATIAYNLLDNTSKSYYYSLANKFFDYMHAGVPSINNNFPEYMQINERYNCCFTEDIETAEELAMFIKRAISDKVILAEKSKNSLLATNDMNWQKESAKLLKIFENL